MANLNGTASANPVAWRYFALLLKGDVTSGDDTLTRGEFVRAGPFATAAEAESTAEEVMRQDSSVVGYTVQGQRGVR